MLQMMLTSSCMDRVCRAPPSNMLLSAPAGPSYGALSNPTVHACKVSRFTLCLHAPLLIAPLNCIAWHSTPSLTLPQALPHRQEALQRDDLAHAHDVGADDIAPALALAPAAADGQRACGRQQRRQALLLLGDAR